MPYRRVLLGLTLLAMTAACGHARPAASAHAPVTARTAAIASADRGPSAPSPTTQTAAGQDSTGVPASVAVPAIPAVEPFLAAFPGDTFTAAAAATRAHRLVSFLALPRRTKTTRPPAALLPAPRSDPRRNLLVRSRFVSVPGSVAALRTFLRGDLPWDGTWATPTRYVVSRTDSRASITVTLLQQHGHVAVRIDGQDIWLPHRSPAEFIPWSMRVVELARTP